MDPNAQPHNTGFVTRFLTASSAYDLKRKVMKLIFEAEVMRPVTSNVHLFISVMDMFIQYEKTLKPDPSQLDKIFDGFLKYFDTIFPNEFPFFLILIHHMRKFHQFYECHQLEIFTKRCIDTFESLTPQQISETLQQFFNQKDFGISNGPDEVNISVFQLLANACEDMMNVSSQAKHGYCLQFLDGFVYSQILWKLVHLKCLCEKDTATCTVVDIWQQHLVRLSQLIERKETVIKDVKLALSVSSLLQLPSRVEFKVYLMTHFVANKQFVQPLIQTREFILALDDFIEADYELKLILIKLRDVYSPFLTSSDAKEVGYAGQDGVSAVLNEGLFFLDGIIELWLRRGWHNGKLHNDFHSECLKWLKMLLSTLKLVYPSAPNLLKKQGPSNTVIDSKNSQIINEILEDTYKYLSLLSIQVFYRLFKLFYIWPVELVHDYLMCYDIPDTIEIHNATWSQFFCAILERFPGDEYQNSFLSFLCKVGEHYQKCRRAKEFIPNLLQLDVPQLLAVQSDTNLTVKEASVCEKFSTFLKSYIQQNNLQPVILNELKTLLSHMTDECHFNFHWIIFNVLKPIIVSELNVLQTSDRYLQFILSLSVSTLCKNTELFDSLSLCRKFCWCVVSTVCSKLSITANNIDWVFQNQSVIPQLGVVFNSYCQSRKLYINADCLLSDYMPQEVQYCPCEDVTKYFEWVHRVQDVLRFWQAKFVQYQVNYDEILLYCSYNIALNILGQAVCAPSFVIDLPGIVRIRDTYIDSFEKLNLYLLQYVPGHPKLKYCTLPDLLSKYGVELPPHIQEEMSKKVIFPGEENVPRHLHLLNAIPSPQVKLFKPGQDIRLKVSKSMTLADLQQLHINLKTILDPLLTSLDALVFFYLHQSEIFEKHLLKRLQMITSTSIPTEEESSFFARQNSCCQGQLSPGLSIETFQLALEEVKDLMSRLLNGKATYQDIIIDGALKFESFSIDKEFSILSSFSEMVVTSSEGLQEVRSMLELFQFCHHILTIYNVCEQYGLENCLESHSLKELMKIVEELRPEGSLTQLTPHEAMKKVSFIKHLLSLKGQCNYNCLNLFSTFSKNIAFYQFINDKQFIGLQGQTAFYEQYQLVTAQLQHEEYDENILNHLRVAFEVVSPLLDKDITFQDLMNNVVNLDATSDLSYLETVNENINVIQFWFSRIEGNAIKNIENELDSILSTGFYNFQLADDVQPSGIFLIFQFRFQCRQTPQPQPECNKNEGIKQRWTHEQIDDFVRKLRFLDAEKAAGEKTKLFLHLNSVAHRLMELFIKLHKLGHPCYQAHLRLPCLFCNVSTQEADNMVQTLEDDLQCWKEKIDALHQQYPQLLIFSMPKLLQLCSLLDQTEINIDDIVSHVSLLFESSLLVRQKLKSTIQEALRYCENNFQNNMDLPMHILGKLLQILCESLELKPFLFKQRNQNGQRIITLPQPTHVSGPLLSMLYYASGYGHSQLLLLICELYGGVPKAYEVFRCCPTTTYEELSRFMERVKHYSFEYLVMQPNKLPNKLKEMLLNLLRGPIYSSTIHFIETTPSVLQELSWITYREHKDNDLNLTSEEAICLYKENVLKSAGFKFVQLVIGHAGDGKTHYIRKQLALCAAQVTIAINEAFTPLLAIHKLNQLPSNRAGCAVFFNFTLTLCQDAGRNTEEQLHFEHLMETINWFFFDLLLLGYIEDPATGASFSIPEGLEWILYIEVPSLNHQSKPEESLHLFHQVIPVLALLGSPHVVDNDYVVDDDVQLVCKYLQAYKLHLKGKRGISWPFKEKVNSKLRKFSQSKDLSDEKCYCLLREFMPDHIKETKITQKLFINYIMRRCAVLDTLSAFIYDTQTGVIMEPFVDESGQSVTASTGELGSTLMGTMLDEVNNFCHQENWSKKLHQQVRSHLNKRFAIDSLQNYDMQSLSLFLQLIYNFRDCGGGFDLLSLHPKNLPEEKRQKYKDLGIYIPSNSELQQRSRLDQYLARALDLPLDEGQLSVIDDANYVLTLETVLKMLIIHEHYECGIPVIIKGDIGVGKTAIVEMLSQLQKYALLHLWNKEQSIILDSISNLLRSKTEDSLIVYQQSLQILESITKGQEVSIDNFITLCQLSSEAVPSGHFHILLRNLLFEMADNPFIALLEVPSDMSKNEKVLEKEGNRSLDDVFEFARVNNTPEATAYLLQSLLKAKMFNTFYKLSVRPTLEPADIKRFFQPVLERALTIFNVYKSADEKKRSKTKMPFVTVFLDEVNTSSCLGLFKEIIFDRTLDGENIPSNLLIVAACNSHHHNNVITHAADTWVRGSYNTHPLPPTFELLAWDYGSLEEYQEQNYAHAKLQILQGCLLNMEADTFTDLIVESQSLVRHYTRRELSNLGMKPEEIEVYSQSCVGLRDIERVFTFYQWLMSLYEVQKQHGNRKDYNRRAIMVSLGIVYYMRLGSKCREEYCKVLDNKYCLRHEVNFSQAFFPELDWFCSNIELPPGIAKTQALKENLLATIVCTVTHTPLIIVGPPGTSKTLSFNLVMANLKGPKSKMPLFRNMNLFKSLDSHVYQCSRQTTSNEIQLVFSRAINRQQSYSKFSLPVYSVVFMNKAELAEESLKVIQYYLDKQEVSFVIITNRILDAAITNCAVTLFQPEISIDNLKILAKECFCEIPKHPPPELKKDLDNIVQLCLVYTELMKNEKMRKFFGLRDFIYFINYLRCRRTETLTPQLIMEGLERNFNGIYWALPREEESFEWLCEMFLRKISTVGNKLVSLSNVNKQSILQVLHKSLSDQPQHGGGVNEVRYKLIIDSSEDNSIVHLLMVFGILDRKNTRVYTCSNFLGDGQQQVANIIDAVCHSASEGHTVVICQSSTDIYECLYNLFNKQFRQIGNTNPYCYANIAVGTRLKPCHVHSNFQCVGVIRLSEIEGTPAPCLNRFEKYYISHKTLLATAMNNLSPCIRGLLTIARTKVEQFINSVDGNTSLYGLQDETLDSLLLSLLPPNAPPNAHHYQDTTPEEVVGDNVGVYLLYKLLRLLKHSFGFTVPVYTIEELKMDSEYLFHLLCRDTSFSEAYQTLTIDSVHQALPKMLQILHTSHRESTIPTQISPEINLVMDLMEQWLVHHMTKQLMQLMTTKAIIVYHEHIPAVYIDNYLTYQQHFSIKKLLSLQVRALQSQQGDTANKLILFTRSSPLVDELSLQLIKQSQEMDLTYVNELVFSDPQKVILCNLSALQSQSEVQELLKTFVCSTTKKILFIMANMKNTTKNMINHLRSMIEEAETQDLSTSNKLFVIMLHFPPAMFFDACYPSIFLHGWSHHYLDAIGQSHILHPGSLDVVEWFCYCFLPNKDFPHDNFINACQHLLGEIIPDIASRVIYGSQSTGPFMRPMEAAERNAKLLELLDAKGVGTKLCQLFKACWDTPVMIEHLKSVVAFTHSHESGLNVTDSVMTMFQSTFTDFMIVMLSLINENYNLDILFSVNCTDVIEELFLSLLESFPTPKLTQLKTLASSLSPPRSKDYQPHFPFFNLVYDEAEKLIKEAKEIKNVQESSSLHPYLLVDSEGLMRGLAVISIVEQKLKNGVPSKNPVYIGFQHLLKYPDELWKRYFTDFIYHCLKLDVGTSFPLYQFMHTFLNLHQLPPIQRLVFLHICMEYNKQSLVNLSSILGPLERLQIADGDPSSVSQADQSLPSDLFVPIQQINHDEQKLLSTFFISAMFSVLVGAVESSEGTCLNSKILQDWYQAYLQIMTKTALKTHLYSAPLPFDEEAKFNIMHSTFLFIYNSPLALEDVFIRVPGVTTSLLSKYITIDLKLQDKNTLPHLCECATVINEVIKASSDSDMELLRKILEGLFSHFFSLYKPTYCTVDQDWFLKLANTQQKWCMDKVDFSSSFLASANYRSHVDTDIPDGCVTIHVFKVFLSRLLGRCDQQSDESVQGAGPLLMYNPEARLHVAAVLSNDSSMNDQDTHQSMKHLMQQPLSHLYFLTLLDNLTSDINNLLDKAGTITQLCQSSQSVPLGEKILLHIEKQAVVQCLSQQIAVQFDSKPVLTDDLSNAAYFKGSSDYSELWELFNKQKEMNAQLLAEMNQLEVDKKKKEVTMTQAISRLQDKYHQLEKTHQQQKKEHIQLQKTHQQHLTRYSQQQERLSQLEEAHHQQQLNYSQLQIEHFQLQENHHHQQEINRQLEQQIQEELQAKQEEMDGLQKRISAMEDSWKVGHKDVIITKEELGRGGWGVIWVGIFREQKVAVKQMYQIIMNPDNLELLHREINTMAQLRHPNLLQFIGAVLDDPSGNPMIITEIMDTSLRNAYETKQLTPDPTCEPVLLTIMRDVAVGLNYLHCLPDPIIHRDVSSANVLLESKGPHKWKTKISDFGSANKARQAVTRGTGAFVYSAPESIPSVHVHVQNALTTKVDVHSYGVLLCEIMTCRFPDPPVFQEMLQHVRSRAPFLHELILSCIKKDPDNRPTIKQVIELLDKYST